MWGEGLQVAVPALARAPGEVLVGEEASAAVLLGAAQACHLIRQCHRCRHRPHRQCHPQVAQVWVWWLVAVWYCRLKCHP